MLLFFGARDVAAAEAGLLESRPARVGSGMGGDVPADRAAKGDCRSRCAEYLAFSRAPFTGFASNPRQETLWTSASKEKL